MHNLHYFTVVGTHNKYILFIYFVKTNSQNAIEVQHFDGMEHSFLLLYGARRYLHVQYLKFGEIKYGNSGQKSKKDLAFLNSFFATMFNTNSARGGAISDFHSVKTPIRHIQKRHTPSPGRCT